MVMEGNESEKASPEGIVLVPPQIQQPKYDMVKENNITNVSHGKPRLRKKALYASILKQMEFYFSDANLNKSRYLSQLIKQSSYVNLDIFIKFNKLRELTTDTNKIAKALQGSTMLKVSEDGKMVCRLTPINKKDNVDECTVYVQNLPSDADHDWLISIFSKYGPVAYVSIPRYKSNRKIKGFAFIEFDTPTSADKCLKTFQEKGCVLPSHTSPDDLLSITTFDDCTKMDLTTTTPCDDRAACPRYAITAQLPVIAAIDLKSKTNETKNNKSNDEPSKDEIIVGDNGNDNNYHDTTTQILGKRKYSDKVPFSLTEESSSSSNTGTKKKKIPTDNDDDDPLNELNEISNYHKTIETTDGKKSGKKRINSTFFIDKNQQLKSTVEINNTCNNVISQIEQVQNVDQEKTKKMRKRNRKRRSKIDNDISCNAIRLQVMAKRDWKRLRNKYLDLQKSKMKLLKQHLMRKTKWNYDKIGQEISTNKHSEKDNKTINEMEKSSSPSSSSYGRVNYALGIIVKIEMDEPCTDPQNFKMEIKDNNSVKYIDVTKGSCEAYIRCDTAEAAQSFVTQKSNEGKRLTVLTGDEENLYWDKIKQDRKEKFEKKSRVKHRGRDKLLKRAEKELGKCIKFDQV